MHSWGKYPITVKKCNSLVGLLENEGLYTAMIGINKNFKYLLSHVNILE